MLGRIQSEGRAKFSRFPTLGVHPRLAYDLMGRRLTEAGILRKRKAFELAFRRRRRLQKLGLLPPALNLRFRRKLLHCIELRNGKKVPRPPREELWDNPPRRNPIRKCVRERRLVTPLYHPRIDPRQVEVFWTIRQADHKTFWEGLNFIYGNADKYI